MDDGGWEECSGSHQTQFLDPPPGTIARYTATGERCSLPFRFQGNVSWGCVGSDNSMWQSAGYW